MTTTSTATIETLTASVQVLKMGTRQITIGIYRQLDYVPYLDLEPFGRVRDSQQESRGVVYVIGRVKATGQLARAYAREDLGSNATAEGIYREAKALPLIILAGAR